MKIYQVEIQTQNKAELFQTAFLGSHKPQFLLTNKTFATREKAESYLCECQKAYEFLQGAAGLGRLQTMRFVLKEYEVEE